MKILLIQPNPRYCAISFACSNIPLGPLHIASALRQAGYSQVRFIDARMLRLSHKEARERIAAFGPDVVGITGMSQEAREVHRLAAEAKTAAPACKVVVGGPYATSSPAEALNDPKVDFVVVGEGERTACALLDALAAGTPLEGVDGLGFKKNGATVLNRPRSPAAELDELPLPAWDLAEVEKYFHLWNRHSQNPFLVSERSMPLITSRGCPYGCIYCHNIFGKKARLRSVESVLGELETLVREYGAEEIEILDDIFNIDLPRAKSICDEIIRRGLNVKLSFPNGLRVDRMDEELVVKLRQAGTHLVVYAIETASPRLQREIKKNLDLEKAAKIIRFTAGQGITVGGFFMLGFPGETRKEMLATIDFAVRQPFDHANFFYVTPKPGTPLFDAVRDYPGVAAAAGGDYFSCSVNLSAVPDWLFTSMCGWAYTRFYRLRPLHLLRQVAGVPNKLYFLKLLLRAFFLRRWA
ncbi:MAG: radical SAM protein [Elusimicrobiota bacterium]|nr:radical SAM protein [Elusimicrobiota bacterium]